MNDGLFQEQDDDLKYQVLGLEKLIPNH